jgi:hypothetical protein
VCISGHSWRAAFGEATSLRYCLREAWDHVVEKAGVLSLVVKRE